MGFDVPEEANCCEQPPGIAGRESQYIVRLKEKGVRAVVGRVGLPAKRLQWSGAQEQRCLDSVEVGEVGIDLKNPIRLDRNDGANVNSTESGAQERSVL